MIWFSRSSGYLKINIISWLQGKLVFFGFIHGKWDVLLVAEAPSEKEFWAPIAQAMFGGMIKDMESFPIIEQETITGAMGIAQQAGYKAPGQ